VNPGVGPRVSLSLEGIQGEREESNMALVTEGQISGRERRAGLLFLWMSLAAAGWGQPVFRLLNNSVFF
jgi:hypothetical protein